MIVWLASYPRSGNTYYRMLLYHLYGVKTFSVYNDPLFERIGASEVVGHDQLPDRAEELAKGDGVYFVKTHDLPTDTSPAIYLVRDGRDALVSYARYIHSFGQNSGRLARLREIAGLVSFRRTLRELIISSQRYGGWSNNVLTWTRRRRDCDVFAVRYEDLVANPIVWLKKSLEGLQIQLEPVEGDLPNFDDLHDKWPQFFRKGKIGSWREEMPKDLRELFWRHHTEAMEAFGYGKA